MRTSDIYIREAWIRRHNPVQRGFCRTLLQWARAARQREQPAQGSLL